MQHRKKYSKQFKEEAVQLARAPGVTIGEVARELGLNASMLGRWCREQKKEGSAAFRGQGQARDEEMARLKRELARVKKERDFLKKAAVFFASESE